MMIFALFSPFYGFIVLTYVYGRIHKEGIFSTKIESAYSDKRRKIKTWIKDFLKRNVHTAFASMP